jgi:hypothetical protein
LLLSAFFFRYVQINANERTAHEAPRALLPRKCRWHKYGRPEVRVDSRKAGPFIQAIVSLSQICVVSQSDAYVRYFEFHVPRH